MHKAQKENLDIYRRLPLNPSSESSKPKQLYDPNSDKIIPVIQVKSHDRSKGAPNRFKQPAKPRNSTSVQTKPKSTENKVILQNKAGSSQVAPILPTNVLFPVPKINFMDKCVPLINERGKIQISKLKNFAIQAPKQRTICSFGRKLSGKSFILSEICNLDSSDTKTVFKSSFGDGEGAQPVNCFINSNFQVFLDYPSTMVTNPNHLSLSLAISNFLWSDVIVLTIDASKNLANTDKPLVSLLVKAREIATKITKNSSLNKPFSTPGLIVVFNSVTQPSSDDLEKAKDFFVVDGTPPGIVLDLLKNKFTIIKYMYLPHRNSTSSVPSNNDADLSQLPLSKLSRFWLDIPLSYSGSKTDLTNLPPLSLNERSKILQTTTYLHHAPLNYSQAINDLIKLSVLSVISKQPLNSEAGGYTIAKPINLAEWASLVAQSWELIIHTQLSSTQ